MEEKEETKLEGRSMTIGVFPCRLSEKGADDAVKLLNGATPSELELTFLQAVGLLALVESDVRRAIAELKDDLAEVRHLREAYAESARLVELEPEQEL